MADVIQTLNAVENGDPRAAELLLPLVYDELRRLADRGKRSRPRRWYTKHTFV